MRTIWRIDKTRYAEAAFRGHGSLHTGGRWHRKGTQVAYASDHPGVAALEKLIWLESYEKARRSDYVLIPLRLDAEKHLEVLRRDALPPDWDAFPHPASTRETGTQWFEEKRSAVLAVPSVVLPMGKNYLINPFHADFHVLEVGTPVPFSWDSRLFKRGRKP